MPAAYNETDRLGITRKNQDKINQTLQNVRLLLRLDL